MSPREKAETVASTSPVRPRRCDSKRAMRLSTAMKLDGKKPRTTASKFSFGQACTWLGAIYNGTLSLANASASKCC